MCAEADGATSRKERKKRLALASSDFGMPRALPKVCILK